MEVHGTYKPRFMRPLGSIFSVWRPLGKSNLPMDSGLWPDGFDFRHHFRHQDDLECLRGVFAGLNHGC